jgi:hypothetical protein
LRRLSLFLGGNRWGGGAGKSFNDGKGANICRVCGGVGLIKKEENDFHGERVYGPVVLVNL